MTTAAPRTPSRAATLLTRADRLHKKAERLKLAWWAVPARETERAERAFLLYQAAYAAALAGDNDWAAAVVKEVTAR